MAASLRSRAERQATLMYLSVPPSPFLALKLCQTSMIHDSREKAGSQVRGVEFRSLERVLRKSSTRPVGRGRSDFLGISPSCYFQEWPNLDGLMDSVSE